MLFGEQVAALVGRSTTNVRPRRPRTFSVSQANERFEITAAPGPTATAGLFVGVNLLGSVVENFDVWVSYELLSNLDAVVLAIDEPAGLDLVLAWRPNRFAIRCSWHGPCNGSRLWGGPDFDAPTEDSTGRVRSREKDES